MPDQKVRPEERAALLPTVLPSRSASTSIYHTVYVQPPPALARELLTEKRRSCGRRLIHWFFIALLGYFSIMYLTSKTSHGLPYPDTSRYPPQSLPINVKPQFCLPWTPESRRFPYNNLYRARMTFTLPASTPELFLLREGYIVPATVHVNQDGDVGSEEIKVEVILDAEDKSLLDEIEICVVKKEKDGGDGFAIAGRYDPRQHIRRTSVDITIQLPKVAKGKLEIPKFNIMDLYISNIQLGNLGEGVLFGILDASTSVGSISARSVQATSEVNLNVKTGDISGTFASRNAITLKTTTGDIHATALLTNVGEKQATLDMYTKTGSISSKISLFHDGIKPLSQGGNFSINAHANVGGVALTTPYIVPSSFVSLHSSTSVGDVKLDIHPSYEGTFSLRSGRWMKPKVHFDEDKEDPEDRGRKRTLELNRPRNGNVQGEVLWYDSQNPGRRAEGKGEIELETSVGDVVLML